MHPVPRSPQLGKAAATLARVALGARLPMAERADSTVTIDAFDDGNIRLAASMWRPHESETIAVQGYMLHNLMQ